MNKKTRIKRVSVVLLVVLLIGGCLYQKYRYDNPEAFAAMPVSTKGMDDWKEYSDEQMGFSIKYPPNYFLDPKHVANMSRSPISMSLSLRQNTASAEECRTSGKRIRVHISQLGRIRSFSCLGCTIRPTGESTIAELEQQFLAEAGKDHRPAVRRTCHRRKINGTPCIVCTLRAPGESPMLTSGIYKVLVLGIHDTADGKRFLVRMDNTGGGTPYTRDRKLRSDVLRVFHTLRWTSSENRMDDNATGSENKEVRNE